MRKFSMIFLMVLMVVGSGLGVRANPGLNVDEVQQMAEQSPIHASILLFEQVEDEKEREFVLLSLAEKLSREMNYELIEYLAQQLSFKTKNEFYGDVSSWLIKMEELEKAVEFAHKITYQPDQEWALLIIAEEAASKGKNQFALDLAAEMTANTKKTTIIRAVAESYAREGQHEKVLELVKEAPAGVARDITLNRVASTYIQKGDLVQAQKIASLIEDAMEKNFVLQEVVLKYQKMGDQGKAMQIKDQLTKVDPYFEERLNSGLIETYIQNGQVEQALELAAVVENPRFRSGAYSQITSLLAKQGQHEKALKIFDLITEEKMVEATFMEIVHEYALDGNQKEAIEMVLEAELKNEIFRDEIFKWMAHKLIQKQEWEWTFPILNQIQDEIQREQVKIFLAKAYAEIGRYDLVKEYIDDILQYPQYAAIGLEISFTLLDLGYIEPVLEISPKIKKVRYQVLVNLRAALKYAEMGEMGLFEQIIDQTIRVIREQEDPRSEILMVDVVNHLAINGHIDRALEVTTQIRGNVEKCIALALIYEQPTNEQGQKFMQEIARVLN